MKLSIIFLLLCLLKTGNWYRNGNIAIKPYLYDIIFDFGIIILLFSDYSISIFDKFIFSKDILIIALFSQIIILPGIYFYMKRKFFGKIGILPSNFYPLNDIGIIFFVLISSHYILGLV